MKILCIGRNYVEHIQELGNERPISPLIFLKPDSALLIDNKPFYYPNFSKDIHYEVELIVKICKPGKSIRQNFAHKYYNEIGLGIDFTARDLQTSAKEKGYPWDISKGFDQSAPISRFFPKEKYDLSKLNFSLTKQNVEVQKGNTSQMIWKIDEIISYVSHFFTLKIGDIIFTGTPRGVGPIQIGDVLAGYLEQQKVLEVEIK